jgi:hypothetical protein
LPTVTPKPPQQLRRRTVAHIQAQRVDSKNRPGSRLRRAVNRALGQRAELKKRISGNIMGQNIILIIYYALTTVCVGISMYLSYYGYLTSFATLAIFFTIAIGLGLFGSDILVQRARVSGIGLGSRLSLFLLFAVFSGVSNFNYLYTNFMERDVVKHALDSQYAVFRNDLTGTRQRLTEADSYVYTENRRVELDRELARLRTQVLDPLRPGCGERCREHIQNIEGILGAPLTDLATPAVGASASTIDAWYSQFRDAVLADFQTLIRTNEFPAIDSLLDDIDQLLLRYDSTDRALAVSAGLPVLRQLSEQSQEIERRANAVLPSGSQVQHTKINVTLGRLGEIPYSLENGFVERPNPWVTIVSAVLALIVDFFPVFFALVAFSTESTQVQKPVRASRRKGRILD